MNRDAPKKNDAAKNGAAKNDSAAEPSQSLRRVRAIALGFVCALLTVVVYVVVYAFVTAGPRLPEVDQQRLDEARQTWQEHGPDRYNIEVTVTGPRAAVYRVEVRDGEAVSATRDGSPLKDRRTMGTWSVPGMFDTIQSDVDHAEEPIQVSPRESHYVSPRAQFHPQYAYPQQYRRIEWGSDLEAGWEVTAFEIVE